MHHTIFTWVHSPRVVIVVKGWTSLIGWIRRSWLEGAVDVVLDEPAVLEHVLDGDLMVQTRRFQELLEMVLSRIGLGRVALGA
jgi:hypothetical protein